MSQTSDTKGRGEYTQMTPRLLQASVVSDGDVDTDEVLQRVSAGNCHVLRRVLVGFVSVALLATVLTMPQLRASGATTYEAGERESIETINEFSFFGSESRRAGPVAGAASDGMQVHWRLGAVGETCDLTCSKKAMSRPSRECDPSLFKRVATEAGLKSVADLSQPDAKPIKCKKMQKKASSSAAPQVYKSWTKGTTCMWGASAPTCGAAPDAGYQRMCPCSLLEPKLQWRLGGKDETCDSTCSSPKVSTPAAPLYCDEKALKGLTSSTKMEVALNMLKPSRPRCTVKQNSKLTSGPEYTKGMLSGTCGFNKNAASSSCGILPTKGNIRICPCGPAGGPPNLNQPWTTMKPDPITTPPIGVKPPTAPPLIQQKTFWVLGAQQLDCLTVCQQRQAICEDARFSQVSSQGVYKLSLQLASPCTMTWANDGVHGALFQNVPAQCLAATGCGVDPRGLCALPKVGQVAHCTGKPPPGYARMCPCKGGSITR